MRYRMGGHGWVRQLRWGAMLAVLAGGIGAEDPHARAHVSSCVGFDTSYVLPYTLGTTHRVWRTLEHDVPGNGHVGRWAIDFEMPIGTPVVAARAGIVVAARDSFADDNGLDLHENFVFVQHTDGTVARYLHLTRGGALARVGDRVRQGQVIARSGNSGQSAGPHLHFDVQLCGPNLPPGYNTLPCGRTVPVAFRNASPADCALHPGSWYRAAGQPSASPLRAPRVTIDGVLGPPAHHAEVDGVAFSLDGRWITSAGNAGVFVLWGRSPHRPATGGVGKW